jgi:hypothetical protein
MHESVDLLGKSETSVVDINLDNFGILREVIEIVLGKSSENGESGSESNDDISFMHGVHCRLVTLITKVTNGETMVGRERIIVKIGTSDGNTKVLGKGGYFIVSSSHGDTTTSEDDGVLGILDKVDSVGESGFTSSRVGELLRCTDDVVVFTIEEVAGNVDLSRSTFVHGDVEGLSGELRHASRVVNVSLEFGDSFEDRDLVEFLETSMSLGHGSSFGSDDHDGRVSPVSSSYTGEEVGDTGSILGDADTVSSRGTRVTIGHVGGILLVSD